VATTVLQQNTNYLPTMSQRNRAELRRDFLTDQATASPLAASSFSAAVTATQKDGHARDRSRSQAQVCASDAQLDTISLEMPRASFTFLLR
jgi:hypothetical protein